MAEGHGGYRAPTHPAPVSGPGKLSRRTDGKQAIKDLPDSRYGEDQAFKAAQQAAPMSESGGGNQSGLGAPSLAPDLSQIVSLGAPSERPEEDVTEGLSPAIPSNGPAGVTIPMTPEKAARLRSYLPVLIIAASQPDSDPNLRQLVRKLRAELG